MGRVQEEIVLEFIGAFHHSWPADATGPFSLLADDVYYDAVVGMTTPIHGRDAVRAAIENQQKWVDEFRYDMVSVGSSDRVVFTERIDRAKANGKWADIPIVGVFEINDDGKICAWREYCDLGNAARQQGLSMDDIVERIKK